jgi:hypothetical protein
MQAAVAVQPAMVQVGKGVLEMGSLQLMKLQHLLLGSSQKGLPLSLASLMSLWVELVGVATLQLRRMMLVVGVWSVAKGQPLSMKD